MEGTYFFNPPRRQGLILQAATALLLALFCGWSLWRAFQSALGPVFLGFLLLSLVLAAPIPMLIYRAYALYKASYRLERDGLRLSWGLRVEDIPMDTVLWVRPVQELAAAAQPGEPDASITPPGAGAPGLPKPWLYWPGAMLGKRRLASGEAIEFLAAGARGLLLVATPGGLFAISPEDPAAFRQTYQRFAEMGTLSPTPARSLYPSFLLARVWYDLPARLILLGGLVFSLALLVLVSLIAPGREQISLGFDPGGAPREAVPAVQLLLLPLLSLFFYLVNLLLGLYFYRSSDSQAATIPVGMDGRRPLAFIQAYLLWGGGALTGLLFFIALVYLLRFQ